MNNNILEFRLNKLILQNFNFLPFKINNPTHIQIINH